MAQLCPAKSTIVPFKKQMYSSGSIILSYKDDKCICVSIHAPTRGATDEGLRIIRPRIVSIHAPTRGATLPPYREHQSQQFQSTHPRGVRQDYHLKEQNQPMFQSTHPRGVRQYRKSSCITLESFNPRTHEGCDLIF